MGNTNCQASNQLEDLFSPLATLGKSQMKSPKPNGVGGVNNKEANQTRKPNGICESCFEALQRLLGFGKPKTKPNREMGIGAKKPNGENQTNRS